MTELNFYDVNEIYAETFYQLPKVFFTNEKYKKISNDAKIAYAILKDRFNYSIKNNWFDDQNHIYFIYTVKELQSILNCGTQKIVKIKKELESAGLLYQKRMGVNIANRLYLLKPIVDATDVYLQKHDTIQNYVPEKNNKVSSGDYLEKSSKHLDNSGVLKIKIPDNEGQTLDNSGVLKIKIPDNEGQTLDNSGVLKIKNNLYKDKQDTNRHIIDSEKQSIQNQILLDNFAETYASNSTATFVPKKVLSLIATFSNTFEEAETTLRTIHNAKHKAETQEDCNIFFEEISTYGINAENELYQTLLKAYQKNKTDKVQNIQNLIFVYVKNWFVEQPIRLKKSLTNVDKIPVVSLENYLNS